MILSFVKRHPQTKELTNFEQLILSGKKIHSLRKGQRWKAGMSIQMATGVRTKYYNQFNVDRPDLQKCISVQTIKLIRYDIINDCKIIVDGRELTLVQTMQLAWNDGFKNLVHFWMYFDNPDEFPNQIVHWTDLKY